MIGVGTSGDQLVQQPCQSRFTQVPFLSALHSGEIPFSKLAKQKHDETVWEELLAKVSANSSGESDTLSLSNQL